MSNFDEYFINGDKPFAENLNDALLLSNVFDMTVPIRIPEMFNNGEWINTTSPRKCAVAIVTLKEGLPQGITIDADDFLNGTGRVKIGFYPNFNSFGKIKSIFWQGSGDITVNLTKTDGTTIASNISSGIITSESAELRKLQEIIIEVEMESAHFGDLEVVMENKNQQRYGAEVGISDVTGLNTRLTSIENKNNQQDTDLDNLTQQNENVYNIELTPSSYNPTIDADITLTAKIYDIDFAPLSKNVALYHNDEWVETKATENGVANFTVNCDDWGIHDYSVKILNSGVLTKEHCQVQVQGWKRLFTDPDNYYYCERNQTQAKLVFQGWGSSRSAKQDWDTVGITVNCPPSMPVQAAENNLKVYFRVAANGVIEFRRARTESANVSQPNWLELEWFIA